MQKYYLNKLNTIEDKLSYSRDNEIKILTYCTLPDKRIKANIGNNINGFQKPIYFDSEFMIEQYKQEQGITFCISGIDVDKI